MPTLSHAYDSLFSTFGGFLPVAFLRAVSYNESSLNPNAVTPSSNATGLFQVVKTVLKDYNMLHGTAYTLEDTKNPTLNTKIGTELISRIVKGYQKNHPSLAMNWMDPRYVALVVQGFNAGYSEAGGVGFVVGKMEKAGIPPEKITVDTVAQTAKMIKASKFLYAPERVRYAKAVANTYFDELAKDQLKVVNAVAKMADAPAPTVADLLNKKSSGSPSSVSSSNDTASVLSSPGSSNTSGNAEIHDAKKPTWIPSTLGNTFFLLALPLTGLLAFALFRPKSSRSQFYI